MTVTDGPFTESKELVSYALYEVRSKEEAVEWASRFIKLHRDLWAGWEGQTDILQVMGQESVGRMCQSNGRTMIAPRSSR